VHWRSAAGPLGRRHDERTPAARDAGVARFYQDHDGPVRRTPANSIPLRQRQFGRQPRANFAGVDSGLQYRGQLLKQRDRRVVVEIIRHVITVDDLHRLQTVRDVF